MSGILGVFDLSGGTVEPGVVDHMSRRQGWRGNSSFASVNDRSAILAVSRYDWELGDDHSGDVLVLDDGRYVVAADASLYYQQDLRRRLSAANVEVSGGTPSHLILAAYKVWGDKCAEYLEGTFAFVIFNRQSRTVLCARDFAGLRPLFYSRFNDTLVVASTVCAILAHPACPQSLNIAAIGTAAAGWILSSGADTCYLSVKVVPPAATLIWAHGSFQSNLHWTVPSIDSSGAAAFDEAALELRELVVQAVAERLAKSGTTAVWMSGGRDSTAVFAAGQHALVCGHGAGRIVPVSISYPEGDLGREDDLIQAVADQWDSPIHWLDIADIPIFDRDAERAASRDEPQTSPYENWNVALARGAGSCGAHIALDGNGGDQLFRTADIYLSDLLRTGHWVELARELWAKRIRGRRYLFEMTFQPLMSDSVLALYNRLQRGPESRHYLEFPRPAWLRSDFAQKYDLDGRQANALPARRVAHQEAQLLRFYLTSPMPGYAYAMLQQRMLALGIEARAPLLDQRIVEFAVKRPRSDRLTGMDDKLLLRASMRGLIPDHVLAPRDTRTGITISYSRRNMKDKLPQLFGEIFKSPLRLTELGIVDPAELKAVVARCSRNQIADFARIALFHTLQTELWLRARDRNISL